MTAPFVATVTKSGDAAAGPEANGGVWRRSSTWGGWRRNLVVVALLAACLVAVVVFLGVFKPQMQTASTPTSRYDAAVRMSHGIVDSDKDPVCSLPADPGMCRGAFPMYFYNSATGECSLFTYGGCNDGNANRFDTIEQCEKKCANHKRIDTAESVDVCMQPQLQGVCRMALTRYAFNAEQGRCVEFLYGGCGANGNNFFTEETCRNRCPNTEPQVAGKRSQQPGAVDCESPADPGHCYAYFEMFTFNASSGRCEKFVFGGCGGNNNRYGTREQCEQTCTTTTSSTSAARDGQLVEGVDYDHKSCELSECPADCGQVLTAAESHDGCVYCKCQHTPTLAAGEVAVRADERCPDGYGPVRSDFASLICQVIPDFQ